MINSTYLKFRISRKSTLTWNSAYVSQLFRKKSASQKKTKVYILLYKDLTKRIKPKTS